MESRQKWKNEELDEPTQKQTVDLTQCSETKDRAGIRIAEKDETDWIGKVNILRIRLIQKYQNFMK